RAVQRADLLVEAGASGIGEGHGRRIDFASGRRRKFASSVLDWSSCARRLADTAAPFPLYAFKQGDALARNVAQVIAANLLTVADVAIVEGLARDVYALEAQAPLDAPARLVRRGRIRSLLIDKARVMCVAVQRSRGRCSTGRSVVDVAEIARPRVLQVLV